MVKLRHISGGNLAELERVVKALQTPINILTVNYVGASWYVHFTETFDSTPIETFEEIAEATKTKKIKYK